MYRLARTGLRIRAPGAAPGPSTAVRPERRGGGGTVRRMEQSTRTDPAPGPGVRPWDADALRAALTGPGGPWSRLDVVDRVGSTNAALLAAAGQGAPDRAVLVAERQEAGRGRLGREWVTRGDAVAVSVLLRPDGVAPERFGWLPLLAGLAVHDAVAPLLPVPVCVKWPNDLLVGPDQRKAGGILAEATTGPDGTAVVLGVGVNVAGAPADLPVGATSLAAAGGVGIDRERLLVALLTRLAEREAAWRAAAGDPGPARAAYREVCGSLGAEVRVELPGGMAVTGMAEDVDADGRLLLLGTDGRRRAVAAGDVVHVRPVERPAAPAGCD